MWQLDLNVTAVFICLHIYHHALVVLKQTETGNLAAAGQASMKRHVAAT